MDAMPVKVLANVTVQQNIATALPTQLSYKFNSIYQDISRPVNATHCILGDGEALCRFNRRTARKGQSLISTAKCLVDIVPPREWGLPQMTASWRHGGHLFAGLVGHWGNAKGSTQEEKLWPVGAKKELAC